MSESESVVIEREPSPKISMDDQDLLSMIPEDIQTSRMRKIERIIESMRDDDLRIQMHEIDLNTESVHKVPDTSKEFYWLLSPSMTFGNDDMMTEYLAGQVDLDLGIVWEYSYLHVAVYYGFVGAVRHLLSLGADVNLVATDGNSPLHLSVKNGQLSTTEVLVSHGAHIDALDANGCIPAYYIRNDLPRDTQDQFARILMPSP